MLQEGEMVYVVENGGGGGVFLLNRGKIGPLTLGGSKRPTVDPL